MATDVKVSSTEYSSSYSSFSGCDIQALITFQNSKKETKTLLVGNIQSVSYSVTREKAPIYTLGSPDPKAFSRGKRGIAGNLVFVTFDRNALAGVMDETTFTARAEESSDLQQAISVENDNNKINVKARNPYYADQIPSFDIVLTGANEYGQLAVMSIIGVEIMNEGTGLSIDDIVNEAQYTFVARDINPWKPIITNKDDANYEQVNFDYANYVNQAAASTLQVKDANGDGIGTVTPTNS